MWIAVLAAFVAAPGGARAGGAARTLDTPQAAAPWAAVGLVRIGPRTVCSGALITDRLVLTAAHCLFDHSSLTLARAEDVSFEAGLVDGSALASRTARRIAAHPAFQYNAYVNVADRFRVDVGVIELDRPIPAPQVTPLRVAGLLAPGDQVSVVSYAAAAVDKPVLQEGCLVERVELDLAETDCAARDGASGAPVLLRDADGPHIAAVLSAAGTRGGREVSLATPVGFALDMLEAELDGAAGPRAIVVAPPGEKLRRPASGGRRYERADAGLSQ